MSVLSLCTNYQAAKKYINCGSDIRNYVPSCRLEVDKNKEWRNEQRWE